MCDGGRARRFAARDLDRDPDRDRDGLQRSGRRLLAWSVTELHPSATFGPGTILVGIDQKQTCLIEAGDGCAVVIVTHDPHILYVADRVVRLEDGVLVGLSEPEREALAYRRSA